MYGFPQGHSPMNDMPGFLPQSLSTSFRKVMVVFHTTPREALILPPSGMLLDQ